MLCVVVLLCCLFSPFALAQTPNTGLSNKLDADTAALHYDDLVRDLPQATGREHDLFTGILADRTSHFADAIRLLTPLANATDLSPSRMALVLGSLADANVKLFHYAQASALYTRLLTTDAAGLPPNLLKDDQDDNDTLKLLLDAPPQTITIDSPIDLPTHSDPLGSITADLTVHGITAPWVFDTGASFSVISETFAHQLGLAFSTGTAHSLGATGVENPIHVAVIDTLPIGSATLHNVVVLIFPDANLTIQFGKKKQHYTLPAALGYPVYQSLGIIRFTHDHRFQAGPTLPLTGSASPIYMEKLSVLFSCRTHNLQRTFLFDSGASATVFFIPYYRDFPADFILAKQGTLRGSGAGGISKHPAYLLGYTGFQLAGRDVDLQNIPVPKTPQNDLFDEYEGSFGRDLISAFASITLDLTHDRVYLGPPVN